MYLLKSDYSRVPHDHCAGPGFTSGSGRGNGHGFTGGDGYGGPYGNCEGDGYGDGNTRGGYDSADNYKPEDAMVQLMFRLSCRATGDC